MLHAIIDWQRASLRPWLELGRHAMAPFDPAGLATALADLALANLAAGEARAHDLPGLLARDHPEPIVHEVVARQPFWRLHAFRRAHGRAQRRVLLAAPCSGYATTLVRDLIRALLGEAEVLVTEWEDARLVPASLGVFDLDDQIEAFSGLMHELGSGLHVVAVSQAAVPALAAAALLAGDRPAAAPATLALLGGPIDPRINPTPANHLLMQLPPGLLEALWLRRVDDGHPGAGRLVLPSLHQLMVYATAHPEPFVAAQLGTLVEAITGNVGGFAQSLADLHAVVDIPAELAQQTLRVVFHDPLLATHRLHSKGRPVRLEALASTALMTVEAGGDALIGAGQTHAAHDLAATVPAARRAALTLVGAPHYALFTGPAVARRLGPALDRFMTEQSR